MKRIVLFFIILCHIQTLDCQDSIQSLFNYSLDELWNLEVSSTSFFDIKSTNAPGYTYHVNMNDLNRSAIISYEDIINFMVPGNLTGRHAFQGFLHGVRGIMVDNNAKTAFMLDGQLINQKTFYGTPNGLQTSLTGDISSIEVVNGPASIAKGSGAINGMINFIPKNGTDDEGLRVTATAGVPHNLYKTEIEYGFSYGTDKDLYLYAGFADASGYNHDTSTYDYVFSPDIRASLADSIKNYPVQGYGKPAVRFAAYWNHENFHLNTVYNQLYTQTNSYIYAGTYSHRMLAIHPGYIWNVSDYEQIDIHLSSELHDNLFTRIETNETVYTPGKTFKGGGTELHLEAEIIAKTLRIKRNQLAIGTSIGYRHFGEQEQIFSENPPFPFHTPDMSWNEFNLFAENIYTPSDFWTFSLGLRYDLIKLDSIGDFKLTDNSYFCPRIAAAYNVNSKTSIKASFQEGFHHPDATTYSIYRQRNQAIIDAGLESLDFVLEPELVRTGELNFKRKILDNKIQVDFNLFYSVYLKTLTYIFATENDDYFGYDSTELKLVSDQLGFEVGNIFNLKEDQSGMGGEFILNYEPMRSTRIEFSYSFAKTSLEFKRYPEHVLKLNLFSRFTRYLYVHLNVVLSSGFEGNTGSYDHVYDSYRVIFNGSVGYFINDNLNINFTAHNITGSSQPQLTYRLQPAAGALGFDTQFYYLTLQYSFGKNE